MSETSLAMTCMGALMPRAHGCGKIQRLKYKVGGAVASGCFALGANLASKLGVTGTVNDTRESLRDVQNDIESGLDLSPIITHRLPIADFQQGFNAMESGEAGKVILDWVD